MTIIYILAAAHGVILALALILSKKKANFFLGGLVATLSLALLHNGVFWDIGYYTRDTTYYWAGMCYSFLFIAPFFYYYILFCTQPERPWKAKDWCFFVPGILSLGIVNLHIIIGETTGNWVMPDFLFWGAVKSEEPLGAAMSIITIWPVWQLIKKYHRRIENAFSDIEKIQLRWLQKMILLCLGACLLWALVVPLEQLTNGRISLPDYMIDILWLVQSVTIFIIGYKAISFPEVFKEHPLEPINNQLSNSTNKDNPFANYDDQQALAQLKKMMEEEQKYQQPKLSLKILAAELKLPVRYVSYLINHHHKTTFHDFVNAYRVEEAIQKMKDPNYQHYTLLAIGMEVGFNSKSAFNYSFKKQTGQSPSAFKKEKMV